MSNLQYLGEALHTLRRRAGMRQGEVETRADIGHRKLTDYETGKRFPSLPVLDRLLGALGVTLKELAQELEHQARLAAGESLPPPVRPPVAARARRGPITSRNARHMVSAIQAVLQGFAAELPRRIEQELTRHPDREQG
jgi:hypothetical protein